MTGLHAHMCVRHTSADAYCLGYDVVVAKEATDSFTEEDYKAGLAYLKNLLRRRCLQQRRTDCGILICKCQTWVLCESGLQSRTFFYYFQICRIFAA